MSTLYSRSLALLKKRALKFSPASYNIVYMGDAWFADGHASNEIFGQCLDEAIRHKPLLVLIGGDAVFTGSVDAFTQLVNEIKRRIPNIPCFVVVGNHETTGVNGPLVNFRNIIGPVHFRFDVARLNLTVIGLNDIRDGLGPLELSFLKRNLATARPTTFVSMHVPPRAGLFAHTDYTFTRGMTTFFRLIHEKVARVLVSHIHAFAVTRIAGKTYILSGGAGAALDRGQINHIVVIHVENGSITQRRIPVGFPPFES